MSYRNLAGKNHPAGVTLVELLITISLIGIISTTAFAFFSTSFRQYFMIQKDSAAFGQLATETQQIGRIVRGLTSISEATDNSMTIFSYYASKDQFVSRIRYYVSADQKQLLAEITPMTSNPPTGTPIDTSMRTITISDSFYVDPALPTFAYLNSSGAVLPMPISDLNVIKGIQINLASPKELSGDNNNKLSLTVSLRNRKTNL